MDNCTFAHFHLPARARNEARIVRAMGFTVSVPFFWGFVDRLCFRQDWQNHLVLTDKWLDSAFDRQHASLYLVDGNGSRRGIDIPSAAIVLADQAQSISRLDVCRAHLMHRLFHQLFVYIGDDPYSPLVVMSFRAKTVEHAFVEILNRVTESGSGANDSDGITCSNTASM